MTNCPNCGAIVTGSICEYCGTRFERKAKPFPRKMSEVIELKATGLDDTFYHIEIKGESKE